MLALISITLNCNICQTTTVSCWQSGAFPAAVSITSLLSGLSSTIFITKFIGRVREYNWGLNLFETGFSNATGDSHSIKDSEFSVNSVQQFL